MRASVAELAKLPGVWRGGELENVVHATVPTGHAALDRELPGGGWPTGTLAEVLHEGAGLGPYGEGAYFRFLRFCRGGRGDRLVAASQKRRHRSQHQNDAGRSRL